MNFTTSKSPLERNSVDPWVYIPYILKMPTFDQVEVKHYGFRSS